MPMGWRRVDNRFALLNVNPLAVLQHGLADVTLIVNEHDNSVRRTLNWLPSLLGVGERRRRLVACSIIHSTGCS